MGHADLELQYVQETLVKKLKTQISQINAERNFSAKICVIRVSFLEYQLSPKRANIISMECVSSKKDAECLIQKLLDTESSEIRVVVTSDATLTTDFGWVVFYNTQMYLETNDIRYAMGGNAPYIVDKQNGSVHVTGTAYPIKHYIREYEQQRSV